MLKNKNKVYISARKKTLPFSLKSEKKSGRKKTHCPWVFFSFITFLRTYHELLLDQACLSGYISNVKIL